MKNNIILIGFMGCGKTSVGIRLSYRLRRTMVDTDKMIERLNKLTVAEIFEKHGEAAFRDMETRCLERLLDQADGEIISVGGGLPVREENRRLLKQLGTVIYLRVTPQTVCRRLASDTTRPLLQGENPEEKVKNLLEQRAPLYEEAANWILDVDDKDFETILGEIVERMEKKE